MPITKKAVPTNEEILRALTLWVAGEGKSVNIAERWKQLKGISGKIESMGGDFVITLKLAGMSFSAPVKKS